MLPNEAPSQEFNQMPTSSEQSAEHHSSSPEQLAYPETEAVNAVLQNTATAESIATSSEALGAEIRVPTSEEIERQAYKNILALTAYIVAMRRAKTGVSQ